MELKVTSTVWELSKRYSLTHLVGVSTVILPAGLQPDSTFFFTLLVDWNSQAPSCCRHLELVYPTVWREIEMEMTSGLYVINIVSSVFAGLVWTYVTIRIDQNSAQTLPVAFHGTSVNCLGMEWNWKKWRCDECLCLSVQPTIEVDVTVYQKQAGSQMSCIDGLNSWTQQVEYLIPDSSSTAFLLLHVV